jgi:hypothetical protein
MVTAVPKVSVVEQVNRSTGNVVPGATFGMPRIPGAQGPPGETRFGGGAWQTTAGVTASWDILEIARRRTIVGEIVFPLPDHAVRSSALFTTFAMYSISCVSAPSASEIAGTTVACG